MNFYTLFVDNVLVRTSHNRLDLINRARLAYPANARVEDCDGRWVYFQACRHGEFISEERD